MSFKRRFNLPENWQPTFKKKYASEMGVEFEIWLSYEGQFGDAKMHGWVGALVVEGIILDAGPFYWDPSDRPLTDENVANHLITWWRSADLAKMLENYKSEAFDFDPQMMAVALVNEMYYAKVDVDFEIIHFAKVSASWKVLMCTNLDENYYEVIHDSSTGMTRVVWYSMVDMVQVANEAIAKALQN
jgi:hypothetical protein